MSRKVCFIDDDGQVGTCITDDEDCVNCDFNEDKHKKWVKEIVDAKNKLDLSQVTIKQLIHEICKRKDVKEEFTPAGTRMIFIKGVGVVIEE